MRLDWNKDPKEWTVAEVECLIYRYKLVCDELDNWRSKYDSLSKRLQDAYKRCGLAQKAIGKATVRLMSEYLVRAGIGRDVQRLANDVAMLTPDEIREALERLAVRLAP